MARPFTVTDLIMCQEEQQYVFFKGEKKWLNAPNARLEEYKQVKKKPQFPVVILVLNDAPARLPNATPFVWLMDELVIRLSSPTPLTDL